MTFQDYFPIWNKLQTDQQDRIRSNLNFRTVKKGTILHNGDMDCTGLLLVKAGQLRAYILSDEGSFPRRSTRTSWRRRRLWPTTPTS